MKASKLSPQNVYTSILLLFISFTATANECENPIATVQSVQGVVEHKINNTEQWKKTKLGDKLCNGAIIQLADNSRAALYLKNQTILRLDENTHVVLSNIDNKKSSWIDIFEGIVHFISRTPQPLAIKTPYANAAIEGTEFVVSVNDTNGGQTQVTVLEGKVRTSNKQGEILLTNGQSAIAKQNQAPILQTRVQPWDAVSWALHYPLITDLNTLNSSNSTLVQQQALRAIVNDVQNGDTTLALTKLEKLPDEFINADTLTYRAALLLSNGHNRNAEKYLNIALEIDADNSEALALKSIIASVQNRPVNALLLASDAVKSNPKNISARLAESYAYQALFQLDKAQESIQQAIKISPDNAIAFARLAELHLMFAELDQALQAAYKASELAPKLARSHNVLGFAHLTQINIDAAIKAFNHAISLDQSDPLPRLGLGLALIRKGQLENGRKQIEIAASLAPQNPLIRSYLGKAYYEEKRNPLAADQLAMAKKLDPKDPTPWFYDAIRKQSENRPIEALQDIQKSIELNDNRAVYRSRLLLDEDVAARSASLAQVYWGLELEQRASTEVGIALAIDPRSYSMHRLLSDNYIGRARFEVARISELMQSQLLQPMNLKPISPQLSVGNLFLINGTGPATSSFNEYNPLFNRNTHKTSISSISGNNNTDGGEIILSGLHNNFSYSLGKFYYNSDGFRENNDLKHDIYNLFSQYKASQKLNIQFEIRKKESKFGDLKFRINSQTYNANERNTTDERSNRIGIVYSKNRHHKVIFSLLENENKTSISDEILILDSTSSGIQTEIQGISSLSNMKIIYGIGTGDIKIDNETNFKLSILGPGSKSSNDIDQSNTYIYTLINRPNNIIYTLGLGYQKFNQKNLYSRNKFLPKLGIQITISERTILRMAIINTMKSELSSRQTIEPTSVAGFNQFITDQNGALATRIAIGADYQNSSSLYYGMELSSRNISNNILSLETNAVKVETNNEFLHQMYLKYLYSQSTILGLNYQFEYYRNNTDEPQLQDNLVTFLDTQTSTVSLQHYFKNVKISSAVSYVDQTVNYQLLNDSKNDGSNFWISDISMQYRLPKRWGKLYLSINNIFDKNINYQNINFINFNQEQSKYSPERIYQLGLTIEI